MRNSVRFSLVLSVLMILVLTVAPASAATGAIDAASLCGTFVQVLFTVTGTVDDGGGNDVVTLEIWDDGVMVDTQDFSVPVGSQQAFLYEADLGTVGTLAPGIGIYLFDGAALLDVLDPFDECAPIGGEGCKTTIGFTSADPAPVTGWVRFYTWFGELFRPEGRLEGSIPTVAGERTVGEVLVACDQHVRAWLFDADGELVGFVPSQFENGDGVHSGRGEDYGTDQGGEPDYYGTYANIIPSAE